MIIDIGIKFIGLTFDEICESQDFSHEDKFILKRDAELEIEKLEQENARLQEGLKEAYRLITMAKRLHYPHTTNSDADYWIEKYERKIKEKSE